jgi:hypothetical protein
MSPAPSECNLDIVDRKTLENLSKKNGYPQWISAFAHGEEPLTDH